MDKKSENLYSGRSWSGAVNLNGKKRYKLIACEIFYREFCYLISQCEPIVDIEFLPKALHDAGQQEMLNAVQEAISSVDTSRYDAIILGFARCNNGVVGLVAPDIPLVIPRAHDCITLFFGSCQAYENYFSSHPGTYYRTSGWTERGDYQQGSSHGSVMAKLGLDGSYEEYVQKYGRENAEYILQTLGSWQKTYEQITYISMDLPLDEQYSRLAENEARDKGMKFDCIEGHLLLMKKLIAGQWDRAEFLVLNPGEEIIANDDGMILGSKSSDECLKPKIRTDKPETGIF